MGRTCHGTWGLFLITLLTGCGGDKDPTMADALVLAKATLVEDASLLADQPPPQDLTVLARVVEEAIAHRQAVEAERASAAMAAQRSIYRKQDIWVPLFHTLYRERRYEPVLFQGYELLEGVEEIVALSKTRPSHGLEADLEALEGLAAEVADYRARSETLLSLMKGAELGPLAPAWAVVRDFEAKAEAEAVREALGAAGVGQGDPAQLRDHLDRLLAEQKALDPARRKLDVALLRAFFELIFEFRHLRLSDPHQPNRSVDKAVVAYRSAMLEDLKTALTDLKAFLDGLAPAHPIYKGLMAGLARYRELSKVKVKKLKRSHIKPGAPAKAAGPLRERLLAEGYLKGEAEGPFDEALGEAIRLYQRTHMLEETGLPDKELYKSLNVPLSRRLQAIEVSLRRWRESPLGRMTPPSFHALVNIAGFRVDFYEAAKIARSHDIIVGSNKQEIDLAKGKRGKLNHTPLLAAEMKTVIFNPLWYVPDRIEQTELNLKLEDNPDYYKENNFTYVKVGKNNMALVQSAGPDNALGKVKFLFPNPFSVYMHDTPSRKLFRHRYRAFSHGCMRVKDPVELAKWILAREGSMKPAEVDKVLEREDQKVIPLKEPIPLFVMYFSTSVDNDGHTCFLADPYKYDQNFLDGRYPYDGVRKIPTKELERLRAEEEARRLAVEQARQAKEEGGAVEGLTVPDWASPAPGGEPAGGGVEIPKTPTAGPGDGSQGGGVEGPGGKTDKTPGATASDAPQEGKSGGQGEGP